MDAGILNVPLTLLIILKNLLLFYLIKMNIWKKAYSLSFGETIFNNVNSNRRESLTRVPGGWVYLYGDMESITTVFVPYNEEFIN